MKQKFGAFGAGQFPLETLIGGRPGTTIFENQGGGGGLGGVAYKDRARPPPHGEGRDDKLRTHTHGLFHPKVRDTTRTNTRRLGGGGGGLRTPTYIRIKMISA